MNHYENILGKLNAFTTKFYTKMLIKGVLLFLAIGLLYGIVVLGIEYFLWLGQKGRLLLFIAFVIIELSLFLKFITIPLIYLFKIKKGLDHKEAALLIGKHFTEIDDKLYNLLDFAESETRSELLMASIDQRSKNLHTIPFSKAIDLKENRQYLKYLLLPVLAVIGVWIFGDAVAFFNSFTRVVHYNTAYVEPAPFQFELTTTDLKALDNEPFTIGVKTTGRIRPNGIYMEVGEQQILLQQKGEIYTHTFTPPINPLSFRFSAQGQSSETYRLQVLHTPKMQNFELHLQYPPYIKKQHEVLKSTGNATVPEGTLITWKIGTEYTSTLAWSSKDSSRLFEKNENQFSLALRIYQPTDYTISTSNETSKDYEKLEYGLSVIRDRHPTIRMEQALDTENPNLAYYKGEVSDDYSVNNISLTWYPAGQPQEAQKITLSQPMQNYAEFYYTFPSGLNLLPGTEYSYYFEAQDNDGVNNPKSAKSELFHSRILDDNELNTRIIDSKKPLLQQLENSLEQFKEQEKILEQMNREQKEKESLSYTDQAKIKDFLKRQQQQEELMQKFQRELKNNLQNETKDNPLSKLLQERLARQELEAVKNEELLKELQEIADKISKENLAQQLEEIGKKQKNSQRNLEQLLELTKRYYIQEKANQLAQKLQDTGETQEGMANKETDKKVSQEEQKKLKEEFDAISQELEKFHQDNQSLRKPMVLPQNKEKVDQIKQEQGEALKAIEENLAPNPEQGKPSPSETVKTKQRSAGKKMKELGQALATSAAGSESSSTAEDAAALMQILDNLVTFSFTQEKLYHRLQGVDMDAALNNDLIKGQQELRELFGHIADSLFTLSLRQAELSEFINEQVTEGHYNLDKTLESLAETQYYQGASYQKYTLNAANSLADFLANVLDNMQDQMQSGGQKGKGGDFQLPDIIMSQKELQEKMEQQKAEKSKPEPGEAAPRSDGEEGKPKGEGTEQNQGQGEGTNEAESQEIYEIYKAQQALKEQLEQQLKNMINPDERKMGEQLVREMEEFQNDILEKGITEATLNQVNKIHHELMKLKNASLTQGEKEERRSTTALDNFKNPLVTPPEIFQINKNEIDVLNRQALPLRQIYKDKVKEYFKAHD